MQEQNNSLQSTEFVETASTSNTPITPQIFYARRKSGMGIILSFVALLVFGWLISQGYQLTTGMIVGLVFFSFILLINVVMYMRPYVTIGTDSIKVFRRQAFFNQIVKYDDYDKGFVINFNAPPGMPKYDYDERLIVSYAMMKDEDKIKLEYALREVVLHALNPSNNKQK